MEHYDKKNRLTGSGDLLVELKEIFTVDRFAAVRSIFYNCIRFFFLTPRKFQVRIDFLNSKSGLKIGENCSVWTVSCKIINLELLSLNIIQKKLRIKLISSINSQQKTLSILSISIDIISVYHCLTVRFIRFIWEPRLQAKMLETFRVNSRHKYCVKSYLVNVRTAVSLQLSRNNII